MRNQILSIFLLSLTSLTLTACQKTVEKSYAFFIQRKGDVFINNQLQAEKVIIFENDSIVTGKQAFALLQVTDQGGILLLPESSAYLEAGKGKKKIIFYLHQGSLFTFSQAERIPIEIHTATISTGVEHQNNPVQSLVSAKENLASVQQFSGTIKVQLSQRSNFDRFQKISLSAGRLVSATTDTIHPDEKINPSLETKWNQIASAMRFSEKGKLTALGESDIQAIFSLDRAFAK